MSTFNQINFDDKLYPDYLRATPNPPKQLCYIGDITLIRNIKNNIAVIGTLNPNQHITLGETAAVQYLCSKQQIIVSGLAHGCDTIGHQVTLDCHGKTIAVLSQLPDFNKIFPYDNKQLAENIVNSGGLLISEYSDYNYNDRIKRLIDRDRLQSYFSSRTFFAASARKNEGDSGSRHCVNTALQQHKPVTCLLPNQPDSYGSIYGLNYQMLNSNKASVATPHSIMTL